MLRSLWAKEGIAAVLTGIATFAIRPALGIIFAPALKAGAHLDHPEVYAFPYGWRVLIPAYITYAEPVIACMCIAFLVWERLSAKVGLRILQFLSLILFNQRNAVANLPLQLLQQVKASSDHVERKPISA